VGGGGFRAPPLTYAASSLSLELIRNRQAILRVMAAFAARAAITR
jgi:hypothetical protein